MGQRKIYSHTEQKFVTDYRSSYDGERWEQISTYPYYVSNYGRVLKRVLLARVLKVPRTIKPFTRRTPGWNRKFNYHKVKRPSLHIIKPVETGGGHQVKIWADRKRIDAPYLHHLVADLFQLREPGEKVSFRDGDEWNSKLSNLKIVGTNNTRLSERQRAFCREMFKKYPSNIIIPELAARFMVGHVTVWRVYNEAKVQML